MTPKRRKTGKPNINAAAIEARNGYLDIFCASMPEQVREPLEFRHLKPKDKNDWREYARRILRAADMLPALAVGDGQGGHLDTHPRSTASTRGNLSSPKRGRAARPRPPEAVSSYLTSGGRAPNNNSTPPAPAGGSTRPSPG